MGLDVYLYKCKNRVKAKEREDLYNKYSDELYSKAGNYDCLTDKQKEKNNKFFW